ncbi:hypothetical protein [Nostoc sp.]|uniref:hypothetical protein n=1 Tax=Nostoc sp. TaxID=1180 RepID=UPI002FF4961D
MDWFNLRIIRSIPACTDLGLVRQQQAIALSTIKLRVIFSLTQMGLVKLHKFK